MTYLPWLVALLSVTQSRNTYWMLSIFRDTQLPATLVLQCHSYLLQLLSVFLNDIFPGFCLSSCWASFLCRCWPPACPDIKWTRPGPRWAFLTEPDSWTLYLPHFWNSACICDALYCLALTCRISWKFRSCDRSDLPYSGSCSLALEVQTLILLLILKCFTIWHLLSSNKKQISSFLASSQVMWYWKDSGSYPQWLEKSHLTGWKGLCACCPGSPEGGPPRIRPLQSTTFIKWTNTHCAAYWMCNCQWIWNLLDLNPVITLIVICLHSFIQRILLSAYYVPGT